MKEVLLNLGKTEARLYEHNALIVSDEYEEAFIVTGLSNKEYNINPGDIYSLDFVDDFAEDKNLFKKDKRFKHSEIRESEKTNLTLIKIMNDESTLDEYIIYSSSKGGRIEEGEKTDILNDFNILLSVNYKNGKVCILQSKDIPFDKSYEEQKEVIAESAVLLGEYYTNQKSRNCFNIKLQELL
jgi:hypothetical protein